MLPSGRWNDISADDDSDASGPPAPPDLAIGLAGRSLRPRPQQGRQAAVQAQDQHYTPFDAAESLREQPDQEEQQEPQGDEASFNRKIFDFRHSKLPEGVSFAGDGDEPYLEEQHDNSTALRVPPLSFIQCILNLAPNGGTCVNDYTLIMDVKLDSLPNESLALYQANWDAKKSEGEAYVSSHGGVGVFGEYGVKESWLRAEKWHRIVVTFSGEFGQSRRMHTFVNGKPCASINKGVFQTPDGRFAASPKLLTLFASSKAELMPGLSVKYVEFRSTAMTKEDVLKSVNDNRIYSFWDVERKRDEAVRMEKLSLQPLYRRPPPIWVHPTFLGMFGDAFLEGTGLDTGALAPCLAAFSHVFDTACEEQKSFLHEFDHSDQQVLDSVGTILKDASALFRKFAQACKNSAQLVHFLRRFHKLLEALKEGEFMLIPGGIGAHPIVYILERKADTFRFVFVNTDPLRGLQYHISTADQPPKMKFKLCLVFEDVPLERVIDDAFWALAFKGVIDQSKQDTVEKIYELLLPWLVNKPLDEAIAETQNDAHVEFRSPQRSSIACLRAVLEANHYLLLRKGLTGLKTKKVAFALRIQLLYMVHNDLQFTSALSDSDRRLIDLARQQCAYTSVKLTTAASSQADLERMTQLKDVLDEIEGMMMTLPFTSASSNVPPPLLDLSEHDPGLQWQWHLHPFFERLVRSEEVDGLAGMPSRLPKYVPIDMLQIPSRVSSLSEAVAALRHCDRLCTLISVQEHSVKNSAFLKCALLEHTFCQVLPVPLPLSSSDESFKCIWREPVIYATQLDVLILAQRLMEHFVSSALSLKPTRRFDAVRLVVSGAIVAIADRMLRKRAIDIPSEVSLNLMGDDVRGAPFAPTIGNFAKQTETIEVHNAELHVARTGVLDYLEDLLQSVPEQQRIFAFENGNTPEQTTSLLVERICTELAFPLNDLPAYVSGEQHLITKNYPEWPCYRDCCFYFKYFQNTELEAFPPTPRKPYAQKMASLRWQFGQQGYIIQAFRMPLMCRPSNGPFTFRFASRSRPEDLASPHPASSEDDILHIKNLPNFESALGQRDAELLLSYLTAPYIRIPLLLTMFATQDRIHSLRSKSLRDVLDSALFEPACYLPLNICGKVPEQVPAEDRALLATPYGLLVNELHHSPEPLLSSVTALLTQCIELDTGSYQSSTVEIILYMTRLACRVDNYSSFLIQHQTQTHEWMHGPLRGVEISDEVARLIKSGLASLRKLLRGRIRGLLEKWSAQALHACIEAAAESSSEMDEHALAACSMQAHLLLLYRNCTLEELNADIVSVIISGFIFLTTRHTWNLALLPVPETEMYELMHVLRRRLVLFLRQQSQAVLDSVLESVVRVSAGTGTRERDASNALTHRWAYIEGPRSIARFSVAAALSPTAAQKTPDAAVKTLPDSGQLGIELDLQALQMTLKSSHLRALPQEIAQNDDVQLVFRGAKSMQAATVETAQHRDLLQLVGRDHDLAHWKTPDPRPGVTDFDREYAPGDLAPSEDWIVPFVEPVRLTYLVKPIPVRLMLPEDPTPPNASVVTLIALHPKDQGAWKEVVVLRESGIVKVYHLLSHGRRIYRCLEYCTNANLALRDLQPSPADRDYVWPAWERHGAGHPYNQHKDPTSVVITRRKEHTENRAGTMETFIPARLLHGIVPSALLDRYMFWQDEKDNLRGYYRRPKNIVDDDEAEGDKAASSKLDELEGDDSNDEGAQFMIHIRLQESKRIDCTNARGVAAVITRVPLNETCRESGVLAERELQLLNLLYAPEGTKLYSIARLLARIERLSYVLAWTASLTKQNDAAAGAARYCNEFQVDLIELPRLKLSFIVRGDRLHSVDHVDLFVCNARSDLTNRLISGIPHSLLLANTNDEIHVLVPAVAPIRPKIGSEPFSTELVLVRSSAKWNTRLDTPYYLLPVHISLSFMFTPALASSLYLLLLRFLHRNYKDVVRLINTIGTDTAFTQEEEQAFFMLGTANGDAHPDAHACRLRISLATIDSPVECPWDLSQQCSRYVAKLAHVSSICRLPLEDELQLLQLCITDTSDPRFDPKKYAVYEIILLKNRLLFVSSQLEGKNSAPCYSLPRPPSTVETTAWPYYSDATAVSATATDWQQISVMFSANASMSGAIVMDIVSQFWKGQETMSGHVLKLGFLFIYGLFTGTITARVCSQDNSRTLATLFLQLFSDRHTRALMPSVLHLLAQNPHLASIVPKFHDKRQFRTEQINGFADDNESSSPIDELFSMLVPILIGNVSSFYLPPDEFPLLDAPVSAVQVPAQQNTRYPQLSDFSCSIRILEPLGSAHTVLESIHTSSELVKAVSSAPLQSLPLQDWLVWVTRKERELMPVETELPFDVHKHPQAKSEVARSMIERLENDLVLFAQQENEGRVPKCVNLLDFNVEQFVNNPNDPQIEKAIDHFQGMLTELEKMRNADNAYVSAALAEMTEAANCVDLPDDIKDEEAFKRYQFVFGRICGKESFLWLEFLIGSLLSSSAEKDILNVNPFLSSDGVRSLMLIASTAIVHANRVGQLNRTLTHCRSVIELLQQAQRPSDAADISTRKAALMQKGELLAQALATKRHYMEPKVEQSFSYDPRFLVFEFTWNIQLRAMQVSLVREFMSSLRDGKSLVKQMIMGNGKTTVVGPLLSLMLGDGRSLVTQVVPPALLEFSRSVMRSTFSSIMHKRIYTLSFDRTSTADEALFNKLEHARRNRGVVISTPTSIKSIMLKFIEHLHTLNEPSMVSPPGTAKQVECLSRILGLFRNGTLVMDEVDLLLHPLKSELNFPTGAKEQVDFEPLRWKLPIHLIDAIFYAERGRMAVPFKESQRAVTILDQLRVAIELGYSSRALQRSPHIVLLNPDFYAAELKPHMASWLLLFLESQHVAGLTEEELRVYILHGATDDSELAHRVNNDLTAHHRKLLNLSRDWLNTFLPHVLAKIDRVSFGLLSEADFDRAIAADPLMPRTRAKLAIPFVGKDVPSRSSEFAHPDVIIGLTILGYRYEGLRQTDFHDIVMSLRQAMVKEVGPVQQRQASLKHALWVREAGGRVKGLDLNKDDECDGNEVVPLRLLKMSNTQQMSSLFRLWKRLPDVVHWYLNECIFPTFMRNQRIKMSASGQSLGGGMLFGRRIGFSGTPSDLLPVELGKCGYEKGSDGRVMYTMTSPSIVRYTLIEEGWTVESLLKRIAGSTPPVHALIDTGALITGLSNLQVAQFLLANGLQEFDGVVFLDEADRKMILVRATGRVVKLEQCGINKRRRFAFYDQVHTTGMDIQHVLDACAVLTLGKDMTFRDYAQGAYRMRGIGKGQTIELYVIPEVEQLIKRELLASGTEIQTSISERHSDADEQKMLQHVTAWLTINSMRSERVQFNQLCLQNVSNVWRKNGFNALLGSYSSFTTGSGQIDVHLRSSLAMFLESIDFSVESCVPSPVPFAETINARVAAHSSFIVGEDEKEVVKAVQEMAIGFLDETHHAFDAEIVQEQEQEQEQQQEQEQEQEIEIEKYVDLAYSRENEAAEPWPFAALGSFSEPPFYPYKEFHLYRREPLAFPKELMASRNYFDLRWSGARRIKNVAMVLEWLPSLSSIGTETTRMQKLDEGQFQALAKAFDLFDIDRSQDLNSNELRDLLRSAMDLKASPQQLAQVLQQRSALSLREVEDLLCSDMFRERESQRFFVTLSLSEAETIRRRMHVRIGLPDTALALRCVAADNLLLDRSKGFLEAPRYQSETAYQCERFFNGEMHYSDAQVNLVLQSLHATVKRQRRIFFQHVLGCRRRMLRKWEETPLVRIFTIPSEFHFLLQRAQSACIRNALEAKGLPLYDAFRMFNHARNGFLSPAELWAALYFLGLELPADDVLDFVRTADIDDDGAISYREFVEMVRDPDMSLDQLETNVTTDVSRDGDGVAEYAEEFTQLHPRGEAELRELQSYREAEECALEEEELRKEREQEREIKERLLAEEIERDLNQEGGPNPKIDNTSIRYDFTTGRRPRGLTSRGDLSYQTAHGETFLKVFKFGSLFLPVPFPGNAGGSLLNVYTISAEIMLDELPPQQNALFTIERRNLEPAVVEVKSNGQLSLCEAVGSVALQKARWHLVSLVVDNRSGLRSVYVDGQEALQHTVEEPGIDAMFALGERLCVFGGSGNSGETLCANIRFLLLETRVLQESDVKLLYETVQSEGQWSCSVCTFRNAKGAVHCSVCSQMRPEVAAQVNWACPVCTFNNTSGDRCSICDSAKP